jgi:hypothetical protein
MQGYKQMYAETCHLYNKIVQSNHLLYKFAALDGRNLFNYKFTIIKFTAMFQELSENMCVASKTVGWRCVHPFLSTISNLTPWFSSYQIITRWRIWGALWKVVEPMLFTLHTQLPCFCNCRRRFRWKYETVVLTVVDSLVFAPYLLAICFCKHPTKSKWPFSFAELIGL